MLSPAARRAGLLRALLATCARQASTNVTDSTQRVNAAHFPHQPLENNLSELHGLLSDARVRQHQAFADTNQDNYKQLVYFLTQYTASLKGGERPPPRVKLEFILPNEQGGSHAFRRVVCTLGSPKSINAHLHVHRSMQSLFREVGLSPNILWTSDYSIPSSHLSFSERSAMEQAQMEKRVESIRAAQRGEALPEDSGMAVASPDALPNEVHRALGGPAAGRRDDGAPGAFESRAPAQQAAGADAGVAPPGSPPAAAVRTASAADDDREGPDRIRGLEATWPLPEPATADAGHDGESGSDGGEEGDDDDLGDDEAMAREALRMAGELDQQLATLAMSQYVRVYSAARAAEEDRIVQQNSLAAVNTRLLLTALVATAQDLLAAVNTHLPGLAPAVQQVWDGERDGAALAARVCGLNSAEHSGYVGAAVEQLVACSSALDDAFGAPDAQRPVAQAKLAAAVRNLRAVTEFTQAWMMAEGGEDEEEEEEGEREAEKEDDEAPHARADL